MNQPEFAITLDSTDPLSRARLLGKAYAEVTLVNFKPAIRSNQELKIATEASVATSRGVVVTVTVPVSWP